MIELQKKIFEFLQRVEFEIRADFIKFSYKENLHEFVTENNVSAEIIRRDEITIEWSDLGFRIYEYPQDFLKISHVRNNKNILIIDYEGFPLSKIDNEIYLDFEIKKNIFFFKNAENYYLFIKFLKELESSDETGFHFIDYYNEIERKIVLTSLAEKSRLILKFRDEIPLLDIHQDYSIGLQRFKLQFENALEQKHTIAKFMKSSFIKFASRYSYDERMELIFTHLINIIEDAEMNFEIYINNLSIDNIKKDFEEFKAKYFEKASDILKKITQQIVGFPLLVASTLFVFTRIKDDVIFLVLLAIIIFITTIYSVLILKMNFKDLRYIKELANENYENIERNNFFLKYPTELDSFKKVKKRIANRIETLETITETYFWVMCISNALLISLAFFYMSVPIEGLSFIFLAILIIISTVRNNVIKGH